MRHPSPDAAEQKEALEGVYREAYNGLVRTFSHEQSLLLEYGPEMNDQGRSSSSTRTGAGQSNCLRS
ncbi:MAG: hypothetical protein H0U76_26375 [Ktedonobacteraceae bacterium]|nr:hypothetical protein [Ktedonobacteraceae bacterium]